MKQFSEAGNNLIWVRPSPVDRNFSLRSGDEEVAALRWDRNAGSLATASSASGNWTFKRIGFLQPKVSVRGEGKDLASFEPGVGGGGVAHLASGHLFRWSSNFWRAEWGWLNAAGKQGVKIHREFSTGDHAGSVTIYPGILPDRELPLLIVLGWYIVILQTDDAALQGA